MNGGGAERMVLNLLTSLNKNLFEPVLLLYQKRGVYLDSLPRNIRIHGLGIDIYGGGFKKKLISLVYNTIKIFKEENPDSVMSFTFFADMVTAISRFFYLNRIKHFMSERTVLSRNIESYRKNIGFFSKRLIFYLFNTSNSIIVSSEGQKDDLIKNFSVKGEKIKKISHGIDLKMVKMSATENVNHKWFKEKTPVVISAGRLEKIKNFSMLLRAFSIVTKEIKCRLVVLGEGKERKKLGYLAKELGLENCVSFPGYQKNPFKYMKRSSVFVLPSLYESFGNVIIEAFACGVPVVSTDTAGSSEIIVDGETGVLVPVNDEVALANAVKEFLINNKKRERFIKNGYESVNAFSLDNYVRNYESLLQ